MANNSINLVALDPDQLKASLKLFLSNQQQFKDYNFDGPNLSTLLDLLSYNSYLNAFYLNMAISEAFLDSAQLPNSVISRAKELNYTPKSYQSAVAQITVQFDQSGLQTFTIPQGTSFTGRNANNSFSFVTPNNVVLYPAGGYFTATNISVYEGQYFQDSFVVDRSVQGQRFILTNTQVDISSITVNVIENNGQSNTSFLSAYNLYGLTDQSNVYFVQAVVDSAYEVVFGDGVCGRVPQDSAVVLVSYRTCSGTDANGSTNFQLDQNLGVSNGLGSAITPSITVINNAQSGANSESIESIRFNAPRAYQTQDSGTTATDFKTLVLQNFPYIKDVNVYGGEEVTSSVQYGNIFIAPVTFSGTTISSVEKSDIIAFLKKRSTIGLTPIIIDPDFLYIDITSNVQYNPSITTLSAFDVSAVVSNAINSFNSSSLTDFNSTFMLSRFEQAVNDSEKSIISNQTLVQLKKIVAPTLSLVTSMVIDFQNPIQPGSISSSTFIAKGRYYQFTDYNSNNDTFKFVQNVSGLVIVNNTNVLYLKDVTVQGYETYTVWGSINYNTGIVTCSQIAVDDYNNTEAITSPGVVFFGQPANQDVSVKQNVVIEIDISNVVVNITNG